MPATRSPRALSCYSERCFRCLPLLVVLVLAHAAAFGAESRPNIVVVLADDLSYGALGCEGGAIAPTPNLDRMAAEGLRFTNCHVQPVCTPTRAQLMTGRGNRRNYVGFGDLADEPTFASILRDAGYATAMAGKWQLGNKTDRPRRAGFDTFTIREQQYTEVWNRYWGGALWVDGERQELDNDRYAPDVQLAWALAWIDAHRDGPFVLYVPTPLVHDAYVSAPQKWTAGEPVPGHETRHGRMLLPEMLTQLDVQMGVLLDHLREAGIAEQTMVWFIGDNGGSAPFKMADGSTLPKGKGTTLNVGSHAACQVWWPGTIAPGIGDDLVCATDVLPTLVELGHGELPPDHPLDGVSLASRFLHGTPSPRTSIYHWWRAKKTQIWVHDRRWKLYDDHRLFDTLADPNEEQLSDPATESETAKAARALLQAELDRQALIPEPKIRGSGREEESEDP
jgi:arylsulfatase A